MVCVPISYIDASVARPIWLNSRSEPQPGKLYTASLSSVTFAGSRSTGTVLLSSTPSSARMVCVGSLLLGSGFFMKWITCARSGGLVSVVLGGGSLGLPSRCYFLATLCALFCALKHHSILVLRICLMVEGSVTFKKAIDARVPTLVWRWPRSFRILRMRIDTSPKSMSTGHGVSHLWQTVQ